MSSEKIIISFTFFENTSLSVTLIENTEIADEKILVKHVYDKYVKADTKGILMLMVPYKYHANIILKSFTSYCKSLPVFGGAAGTNENSKAPLVISNKGVSNKGVVFVFMHSDSLNIATDYHLNWQAIGKQFAVTKSEGRLIKEIDNIPASDVFTKYLGKQVIDNLPYSGMEFPFVFNKNGIMVARAITGVTADKSIELSASIENGDVFQFSYGHVESILEKDKEIANRLANIPIQTILLYSCGGRLSFLKDDMQLELNPLKELAPSVGFFTFGEFHHHNNCNLLLNQTLTMVMLSESNEKLSKSIIDKSVNSITDNIKSSQVQILRVMTNLIKAVTHELNESNENLYQANEELTTLLTRLQERNNTIEKMNTHITSSIQYARKIQEAMLPPVDLLKKFFKESFILYKPRDIVSGDFYWMKQVNQKIYIATADCTGHGVPGAFMSMLGISFLDEIVIEQTCKNAGEILNQLREKIKKTLKQKGENQEQKDGMDMAICIVNKNTMQMQYAGAYNPLYIIRKNEKISELKDSLANVNYKILEHNDYSLIDVSADRQPIAIYLKEKPFTTKQISIKKDDLFYTFSDGFIDQPGGQENKKYLTKNFKNLLLNIHQKTLNEQNEILNETIEEWKNGYEQIDDILVIGVRI